MQRPIYFDNQATTPVDPRVLEAMLPYFCEQFGNAASRSHAFGWAAEKAVERARLRVAEVCGASAREIVFTSGATESNNLALKGAVEAYQGRGNHIVTMSTEHPAVLDTIRYLAANGISSSVLPPRADGLLDLDLLRDAIRPETVLVSVMSANNEIGVVEPVREIGEICRRRGVLFHVDGAQSFGKVPLDVVKNQIDLLAISAHKIYGPKGVGALYVRRGVRLAPQVHGGGHEHGLRSGTVNVPGIVGLGEAAMLCASEMQCEAVRIRSLRDRLYARIKGGLEDVAVNGSLEHRLPGNLNLMFDGIDAAVLLTSLPDVALSTGSACSSASPEPSHVLRAIGLSPRQARSSIRFSLGRSNTEAEVDHVAGRVIEMVKRLRMIY
ncbi:MAG: aminotransferase class V-fold PLP-dependent enzyme [Acidobacteriia bacterium]|nr:aminotransferase class V-fold PLP-dependent enzyme [Terriglobia bacterium]